MVEEFNGARDLTKRLPGPSGPWVLEQWSTTVSPEILDYFFHYINAIMKFQFFITKKGYIGFVPRIRMNMGTKIHTLAGCRVPLVVRQEKDHYSYWRLLYLGDDAWRNGC
jgi:hypothetical protein